jgi:hypothetical protein
VPLGVIAGLTPESWTGRGHHGGLDPRLLAAEFLGRLMLIMIFAVFSAGCPPAAAARPRDLRHHVSFLTWDGLRHMILPAFNLALFKMALVIRLARAGTREVMLPGLHQVRPRQGPVAPAHRLRPRPQEHHDPDRDVVGLELGSMIAFAVVTETVFAWPGMGKLLIDSINRLDRPVIVAYLMLIVLMFVVINLVVDISTRCSTRASGSASGARHERTSTRRSRRGRRRPARPSPQRRRDPFRRFVSSSRRARSRWGLACSSIAGRRRPLRALDRAAEPLRPRQLDDHGQRLPPGTVSMAAITFWLGTDDQGRDMLLGHHLRPAHLADRRRVHRR